MDLEQNIDGGISPDSLPPINNSAGTPGVAPTQAVAGAGQQPKVISGQLAGFFTRLVASLIDGFLLFIIQFVVGMVFMFGPVALLKGQNLGFLIFLPVLQFISQLVITMYYYGVYQHNTGQTVGKKVMGIKVVDAVTGQTPTVGKFLLRDILGKIISAFTFTIGYLMVIWDSKKQALHDKVAGTVVIKV